VKQQWEKAFGIEVELQGQEWVSYYNSLVEGTFLAGGLSWHSRVRDPIYNLSLFKHKEDKLNVSRWENPEFSRLLNQAEEEIDAESRGNLLVKAEQLLMDEMPVIPIYFLTVSYLKNSRLENVYVSDINEIDFAMARKIVD
jgi:oligopeptide transport system substrate-binding protein